MTNRTGRITRWPGTGITTILLLSSVLLAEPRPTLAQSQLNETGKLITVRRSVGLAFLAGGVYLGIQGFDLKDEADEFYAAYEAATDPADIEKFYQRTTNRDVKSQVSWALAAAFGITGLRLALTGDGTTAAASQSWDPVSTAHSQPSLSLVPAVTPRVVGLRLQHHFF